MYRPDSHIWLLHADESPKELRAQGFSASSPTQLYQFVNSKLQVDNHHHHLQGGRPVDKTQRSSQSPYDRRAMYESADME